MTRPYAAPALIATFFLAACATPEGGANYPSLAQREAERQTGQFEAAEPRTINVPPVAVDESGPLPERLAALVAQGEKAHRDFLGAQADATARANAAAGSAIGSDAWASAQVALAGLDSARSEAAIALGDLDELFVAATVEAGERSAIAAARAQVEALVAAEDAVLAQLRAKVR